MSKISFANKSLSEQRPRAAAIKADLRPGWAGPGGADRGAHRLAANGIKIMLKHRGRAAGRTDVHAHRWRHNFAHEWKRAGGATGDLMLLLDDGIQYLTLALELMTDPHAMYQTGSDAVRTIMNRSIFTKLYADGDTITDHELREPFNVLADAYTTWQGYPHQTDTTPGLRAPNRATRPRSTLHAAIPTQRSSAAPEAGYGATEHLTISPALALAGQGSNKTPMVDLLIAYSKRLDLLSSLVSAVERARVGDDEEPETGSSVRSDQAPRVWRVSDRLAEADLCTLISCYRSGTTVRELAERFNLSKSSVKRLLRERGIRRAHAV